MGIVGESVIERLSIGICVLLYVRKGRLCIGWVLYMRSVLSLNYISM